MSAVIVGRDAELASLRDFVAGLSEGASALVLEGEAGVGKTTLWTAGIEEAEERALLVLQARSAQSEAALSFSGLGDLLDPVLEEALDALPPAQGNALSRALILGEREGPPPDPHAVGVAVLNSMRALAAGRPLVTAIDDVQWLDPASAAALVYAGRRLRREQIGVLLARRAPFESALLGELRRSLPTGRLHELEVGPLDLDALHHVVQGHLGIALPRPLLADVRQASGGNPFFALELVRSLQRRGQSVEAGELLPLPESLQELVRDRLLALPNESRDYLLAAAALSHPTFAIIEEATGVRRETGLIPALEARVVELDHDRIRFTHPLLAAGAYELADPLHRAALHARLATLVSDPESRGRHLAASVTQPDESVALALEDGARHARARGAPRSAALLLDRARELTPPDRQEDAQRRAVDAAYLHFESGDSRRAEEQLMSVIAALPPGDRRARAVVRLARIRSYEDQAEAAELFLQAVEEAGGDRELLAVAHEGVSACLFRLRTRLDESVEHAEIAAQLALELGDDALAAESLGSVLLPETILGRETAAATASRVLGLQDAAKDRRVLAQPLFQAAVHWWWTDAFDEARDALLRLLARADELGDESSVPYVLVILGQAECARGELESALARAHDGQAAAQQAGQRTLFAYHLALEGLVKAQLGSEGEARSAARRALELVPETGGRPAELVATAALGHLELTLGAADAAVEILEPAVSYVRREHMDEPAATAFVIDAVEAMIECGRIREAEELLDWHEGNARRLQRASALAACLRCRGLLAASEGRVEEAGASYESALGWHGRVDVPLDRGRTVLQLGVVSRRAKRRSEARATLGEALAAFERIGARLWAERARAELRRISGRAATPGALTPAEERIAALVADGKTNREVAAALFLSERTVEGHLSRVYGKLGVRSRTELARELASRRTREIAASNTGDSPVSRSSSAS